MEAGRILSPEAVARYGRLHGGDWADGGYPVSREMIERLVAFLGPLNQAASGGMPEDSIDDLLGDLHRHLYADGWVILVRCDFCWWQWWNWGIPEALLESATGIETTDVETLRRVLTCIARRGRDDGLGDDLRDRHLPRILRRLGELAPSVPPAYELRKRSEGIDACFAHAADIAAQHLKLLPTKNYILESQLEQVLLAALSALLRRGLSPRPQVAHGVTTWNGNLGRLDLGVTSPATGLEAAAELKIESVHHTLWDAYKLAAIVGYRIPGYTITLASTSTWEADGQCTEFFQAETVNHSTKAVFERNAAAWEELKLGGTARPERLPALIQLGGSQRHGSPDIRNSSCVSQQSTSRASPTTITTPRTRKLRTAVTPRPATRPSLLRRVVSDGLARPGRANPRSAAPTRHDDGPTTWGAATPWAGSLGKARPSWRSRFLAGDGPSWPEATRRSIAFGSFGRRKGL